MAIFGHEQNGKVVALRYDTKQRRGSILSRKRIAWTGDWAFEVLWFVSLVTRARVLVQSCNKERAQRDVESPCGLFSPGIALLARAG